MTTEILNSTDVKVELNENKINYLWLNGERVIGIKGLQVFEDCGQVTQTSAIRKEQIDALNNIINATLEKQAEEGICNNWSSLITAAKNYLSEVGYCVINGERVTIDLRKPVEVNFESFANKNTSIANRILTAADLWKIYQGRKVRQQRIFL
jgi:hypothetical protein